jgi:1-deoxy-D-xylulose-5-phosphate reductoisomerase
MRKKVAVLGATGSIGTQALNVIASLKDRFEIVLLSGYTNTDLLLGQKKKFNAKRVYALSANAEFLPLEKLNEKETYYDCDIVINGISGLAGLLSSVAALEAGAILATANKESIICGWRFMNEAKQKHKGAILPVDSEHSTIFRLLRQNYDGQVIKIILTASGGALRDCSKEEIAKKRAREAIAHPTWNMGKKVTIDSATLMNKGMEIIEAKHLFGINDIRVLGHRESVIHAMIQYSDNSYTAGLSVPDMRLPIAYALNYPQADFPAIAPLDFTKLGSLNFFEIDRDKFPCLKLAEQAAAGKEELAIALNAANEVMVNAYLNDKASFYDISDYVEDALSAFGAIEAESVADVISIDRVVREYTIKKASLGGLIG